MADLSVSERREFEDSILSRLPPPGPQTWPPTSLATLPVRMCTVSHCHAILSASYEFRRCEQHRRQNRHHSQLKRVREKEVKSVPIFLNGEWRKTDVPFGNDDDEEVEDEDEGASGNEGEGVTNENTMDGLTDQVASTSAAIAVDAEVHLLSSVFFSSHCLTDLFDLSQIRILWLIPHYLPQPVEYDVLITTVPSNLVITCSTRTYLLRCVRSTG